MHIFMILFIATIIVSCGKTEVAVPKVAPSVETASLPAPIPVPVDVPAPVVIHYTKLDQNGSELPANAVVWDCVRDNTNGLIWENKTDDDGLRDKDWRYTWYDTDTKKNAGFAGVSDEGVAKTNLSNPKYMKELAQSFLYANSDSLYAIDPKGIDNCFDKNRCDTKKFVEDVNTVGLCAAKDWRLPTLEELKTLIKKDRTDPVIDIEYFPNTISEYYWSGEAFEDDNFYAWSIGFQFGNKYTVSKANLYATSRLVRKSK